MHVVARACNYRIIEPGEAGLGTHHIRGSLGYTVETLGSQRGRKGREGGREERKTT